MWHNLMTNNRNLFSYLPLEMMESSMLSGKCLKVLTEGSRITLEETRLPTMATALTWTPGRRLPRTRLDTAPVWSSHVRWQPWSAPVSPFPARRSGWPHHRSLCSGPRRPYPRCGLHAPPAAAHAFCIFSAGGGGAGFTERRAQGEALMETNDGSNSSGKYCQDEDK